MNSAHLQHTSDEKYFAHDMNLRYKTAQAFIFAYLFCASFGALILYIPLLAPALLLTGFILCAFVAPNRLRLAIIPFSIVFVMAVIDSVFHYPDIETLKAYFFWAMVFASFAVLHRDPTFLYRCSNILLLFILVSLMFVSKNPANGRLIISPSYNLGNLANSNDLADSCGFAILFSLYALFLYKQWPVKIFYAFSAIACSLVLLGTVSRGGLIITSLCILLYLLLNYKNVRLIAAVVFISSLFLVRYFVFSKYISHDINTYQQRFEDEGPRPSLLRLGAMVLIDNPLVGTGINDVESNTVYRNSPHNFFLALGVHYGFAPALMMLLLWIITLRNAIVLYFCGDRELYGHILVLCVFLFSISCISNTIMLYAFCALYMSKAISGKITNDYSYVYK
jgi:hypothetical protein